MATPGNNPTTLTAVLKAIVSQLATVSTLTTANTFICAEVRFLGTAFPGDVYVEVVLGSGTDHYANEGIGMMDDDVTIAIYKRLQVDVQNVDTQRLADQSLGVLQLVDSIFAKLTNNFLNGLLLQPMTPMRREPGDSVPVAGAGWATVHRRFKMRYLVTYPDPQQLS